MMEPKSGTLKFPGWNQNKPHGAELKKVLCETYEMTTRQAPIKFRIVRNSRNGYYKKRLEKNTLEATPKNSSV